VKYTWDFSFLIQNYPLFLRGLLGTLKLAASALSIGLVVGVVIAMARMSKLWAVRLLASSFVELFRNIPPLILLFWFFYAIPIFLGWQSSSFFAAFVGLSLYVSAYSAEIYRTGIQSIDRGQVEAAKAVGFSYGKTMRYVVLPQAIKRMIPALTNQSIELVKSTALASTIAYAELLYEAKLVSDVEFRPLESYTTAAVIFIAVLVTLSFLSTRIERRIGQSG
jgi:polar amino acid transport system permease protein